MTIVAAECLIDGGLFMKLLFVSSEAAPFFKTGGLGDVAYALPKELKKQGIDVRVALPYYLSMPQEYKDNLQDVLHFRVQMGHEGVYAGVKTLNLDGIEYYFIDNLQYFDRPNLYGYHDDGERFAFFDMAVIEMMERVNFIPNIIHCNDWQTGMIPALLVDKYHWINVYRDIRKVFTIHNIRFQGQYNPVVLSSLFGIGYSIFHDNGAKHYEDVNFLKAGINYSDIVTTVSPTYAREIQTPQFGEGLDGVLRNASFKLRGIINGIDYEENNPQTDEKIPFNYSLNDMKGKLDNKLHLQSKLNLPQSESTPLIGVVSRLTNQKGMQLVQEIAEDLLTTRNIQIVVLGTGEQEYENSFRYFDWKYNNQFRAIIDFDIALAQQIYAGADMFLMPSAFEPCGLSQMISLRYGTLPIVHETGGLSDTIVPYNKYTGEGTGFTFYDFNGYTLLNTIYRALHVYDEEPEKWKQLIKQGMEIDFSWTKPANEYIDIYNELLGT